jgi:hypothetical protein
MQQHLLANNIFRWLLGILVLLALIPVNIVFIAEWNVRVTDEREMPLSGIRVSQNWQNYTLGMSGGQDLYTGSEGTAVFTKRQQRAPIGYWFLRMVWTRFQYGVHASSGTVGTIRISDLKLVNPAGANCSDLQCTNQTIQSTLRSVLR